MISASIHGVPIDEMLKDVMNGIAKKIDVN